MESPRSHDDGKVADLEARLADAEATLSAIRAGEVDAVVVATPVGDQVFTLQGAERPYRLLVEEMTEAALILSLDGTVLYANASFSELTRAPVETIVGASFASFFIPDHSLRALQLLVLAKGSAVRQELEIRALPGAARPVNVSVASLAPLGVDGFSVLLTDLTHEKAVQAQLRESNETLEKRVRERTAALQESEDRFRTMADGSSMMIWVADPDGRIRFVNRAYTEFFGVSAEQIADQGWEQLFHPNDRPAYLQNFHHALREHKPFRAQARVRRHDGTWRWVDASGEPRFAASGEFLGIVGSSPDITERKEFQMELERLVAERTVKLQEMVGELEHVSYSIAHDMRGPLRAMQGFATFLSDELPESASNLCRNYCRRIEAAARRIDLQITDALNYTRAVLQDVPMQALGLEPVLRSVLETYPNLFPDKADIIVEGELPVVIGNEALLSQCFSNLLGNAVKFVAPGARPKVRVWGEARPGKVCVWVEDNGIGIPDYAMSRLFGMFQKLAGGYEGTGVGLAIVRKVVERMGEQVGVESKPGVGSRFWVELRTA